MSPCKVLIRKKGETAERASAIDQLLTRTGVFRAAVSFGGVADWLTYYESRRPLGDETIPGFLGGKTPENAPDLYRAISPVYHADRITTPLLLAIGDNDSRFTDTVAFHGALRKAGRSSESLTYFTGARCLDPERFVALRVTVS